MPRVGTFFLGFLVGGAVVYTSLHYHIVRANDGVHFIPKMTSSFSETYVDVRHFSVQDWADRVSLSTAVTAAGKSQMMHGSLVQPMHQAVDGFMGRITN
jgi:hypothetical protein